MRQKDAPSEGFFSRFVAARFWIAPAYVGLYYLQDLIPEGARTAKRLLLLLFILVMALAIPANGQWVPDYRDRLKNGIRFILAQRPVAVDEAGILEHIRWCNAKILFIMGLILGILSQFDKIRLLPYDHWVPAFTITLLVFVALFDAALDLEAEWTISLMAAWETGRSGGQSPGFLSCAIWHTNQYRPLQKKLYADIAEEKLRADRENLPGKNSPWTVPEIEFGSFSATAQNLLSFAMIVVPFTAFIIVWLLVKRW